MPNPRLLPCDTDALIQIILTAAHTKTLMPLRMLKDDYGIQPSIVPEVEVELMQSRKFGARFAPELRKAVGNGTIEILDVAAFARYVPGHLAKGVFGNFQALGLQYNKFADRGESYTLAAAVTLGVPALSNDKSALDALDFNGMVLPMPVLRVFDLLAFCYQAGVLEEKHCDGARKELMQRNEHVPAAFKNASFIDGLTHFSPRILDSARPRVGVVPRPGPGYTSEVSVTRI
jgi:hypothetical protein